MSDEAKKYPNRFQPGQSGNPSGRPKIVGQVRDLARAHTEAAIRTLAEICSNADAQPAARVAAANAILDRGYGRPTQYIENKANPLDDISDEDLSALEAALTGAAESVAEHRSGRTH